METLNVNYLKYYDAMLRPTEEAVFLLHDLLKCYYNVAIHYLTTVVTSSLDI